MYTDNRYLWICASRSRSIPTSIVICHSGNNTIDYSCMKWDISLQWRHNERNGVSNLQPYHRLLERLFRHRWKKASKRRVTGLCEGNSPVTGEFPAQRASNAEDVSIWWRHHICAATNISLALWTESEQNTYHIGKLLVYLNVVKRCFI